MPKKFYPRKLEESIIRKEEEERNIEKMKNFIERIADRLKGEKAPVGKDCRINLDFFRGIYPTNEIERDKKKIKKLEEKWYKNLSKEEIEKERLRQIGEQLEILKTAILYKNLHKEFIVVRASVYDDIKNGVDNLILEKETGNLICVLDEVSGITRPRIEEKKRKILNRNRKGGGKLKYGIKLEKGKIVLGEIKNIPIFYFALPQEYIKEGVKELIPSFEKRSEWERNIFNWFFSSLTSQLKYLKLESNLPKELKEKLTRLEKFLKRIKNL